MKGGKKGKWSSIECRGPNAVSKNPTTDERDTQPWIDWTVSKEDRHDHWLGSLWQSLEDCPLCLSPEHPSRNDYPSIRCRVPALLLAQRECIRFCLEEDRKKHSINDPHVWHLSYYRNFDSDSWYLFSSFQSHYAENIVEIIAGIFCVSKMKFVSTVIKRIILAVHSQSIRT